MSEQTPATRQNNLPSIAEIYADNEMSTIRKDSLFEVLVNQPPKKEWLKDHPLAKTKTDSGEWVPVKYIPIERVEWLLTNIFLKKRVEIKSTQLIANSVAVTVRLHYYNHIDKEWLWQDGIGAAPLQTDSGHGATDFNAIKSNAVQIGAPAAESYAVKDAAEKIGKLFGKDLNRKEVISYDTLQDRYSKVLE